MWELTHIYPHHISRTEFKQGLKGFSFSVFAGVVGALLVGYCADKRGSGRRRWRWGYWLRVRRRWRWGVSKRQKNGAESFKSTRGYHKKNRFPTRDPPRRSIYYPNPLDI